MKIAITGSTGLIGSALIPSLTLDGHQIVRLVRSREQVKDGAVYWNPAAGEIDTAPLAEIDAVVHLAGKGVASGRWTEKLKQEIYDSRVQGTALLCDALASLERKPSVLISASAVGFYGDRGDELLREEAGPGEGYLAEVTKAWEEALQPAIDAGIRTVALRTGVVLARASGALPKMVTPFKVGLGGKIGNGEQYMSWIALDDQVGIIRFALQNESLSGPVNTVAPKPVTNAEFTRTLGEVLGRPTVATVPEIALKMMMGSEMAKETVLASVRVEPSKLLKHGYEFSCPDLETTLRGLLGK